MNCAFLFILVVTLFQVEAVGRRSINAFGLLSVTRKALDRSIAASLGVTSLSSADTNKKSSTKTFEAIEDVERAFLQAGTSPFTFTQKRLDTLAESIDLAAKAGSFKYARWALGTGLYGQNRFSQTTRRKRRSGLRTPTEEFLVRIQRKIGHRLFQKMMSVSNSATLMFAIDTTGSMLEEIQAAKDIASTIVKWPRNKTLEVDYTLSPFGDPGKSDEIHAGHYYYYW